MANARAGGAQHCWWFPECSFSGFHNVLSNFLEPVLGDYLSPSKRYRRRPSGRSMAWVLLFAVLGILLAWIIAKKASPWPSKLGTKVPCPGLVL